MSWIITHQCRFQSRTHQQYCVNVSKQSDVSVEIKQLIGAETPFSTSEASGDDIFTPVRPQTGYLRILDNSGGTLLDDLLPENNTQKMVTLVNLTTGATEWIGFMAAEVFTQPWDNDLTELEFPLKSALACLADVTMQIGVSGTNRLALLVYNAITSLFGEGNVPFTELVFMDDFKNTCTHMTMRANMGMFFNNETIMNDNSATVIRVGKTYKNSIDAMCQVFGLTLREQGTSLIFGRYDDGGNYVVNVNKMDWAILAYIANSTSAPTVQPQGQIVTKEILPIADFKGNNNNLSFMQGAKSAMVALELNGYITNLFTTPQSEIKDTDIRNITVRYEGTWGLADGSGTPVHFPVILTGLSPIAKVNRNKQFYVAFIPSANEIINIQISDRLSSVEERFYFYYRYINANVSEYTITRQHNAWMYLGSDGSRSYVLGKVLTGNSLNVGIFDSTVFSGAIPCRWSKNNDVLHNGILLIHDVWRTGDTGDGNCYDCYEVNSYEHTRMENCYININFTLLSLITTPTFIRLGSYEEQANPRSFSTANYEFSCESRLLSSSYLRLQCVVSLFNDSTTYYWNGNSWQTEPVSFQITIKAGNIVSNKPSNLNSGSDSGFFIPVTDFTGKVKFRILNVTFTDYQYDIDVQGSIAYVWRDIHVQTQIPTYPFVHLLNDIEIGLVYPRNISSTSRTSNVYRRNILDSGFSEDKEKTLSFGTINNNDYPYYAFLRNSANTAYIQNVEYAAADGSTVSERPEMHLLNRMVEQYKTMRRTMTAKIATGIDLFRQRFAYNGRLFMAIDKKHDWEREEQEVKFIEVN